MRSPRRPPAARPRSAATVLRTSVAAGAALLAVRAGPLRAEEFFATRNQNPLLRGFYLPLPSDARQDAAAALSGNMLVTNTHNDESNSHESVLVHGESTALDLTYENALSPRWRCRFTVPIIHD